MELRGVVHEILGPFTEVEINIKCTGTGCRMTTSYNLGTCPTTPPGALRELPQHHAVRRRPRMTPPL